MLFSRVKISCFRAKAHLVFPVVGCYLIKRLISCQTCYFRAFEDDKIDWMDDEIIS